MADQSGTDVYMRVVKSGTTAMAGQSSARLSDDDPLTSDFKAGMFFELRSFDFAVGIEGDTPRAFKAGQVDGGSVGGNTIEMQPIGYSRVLDTASTLLFKALVECTTLSSVSVVKRKASGGAQAGSAYIRLDFNDVLLTALTWRDGGQVTIESGQFIYKTLKIQYRPQVSDGSLGATSGKTWKMSASGKIIAS